MEHKLYKGVDLEINKQLQNLLKKSQSIYFASNLLVAMGLPIPKKIKIDSTKELISLMKPIVELANSQISKLENLDENVQIATDLEDGIEKLEKELKELEDEKD